MALRGTLGIHIASGTKTKHPALSRLPLWASDLAVLGLLVAFGFTGNGWWLVAAIAAMIGIWIAARRTAPKKPKMPPLDGSQALPEVDPSLDLVNNPAFSSLSCNVWHHDTDSISTVSFPDPHQGSHGHY